VKSKRHRPKRQREALQFALGARVGDIGWLTPHDVDLPPAVTIRRRHYLGTIRASKSHRMPHPRAAGHHNPDPSRGIAAMV
jgi:hypothetical protein